MKKVIFPLLFLCGILITQGNAYAQDNKNEIYAGYSPLGIGMQMYIDITVDVFDDIFTSWGYSEVDDNSTTTGIIMLGYNRFLNDWLKLGVNGSYIGITTTKDFKKDGHSDRSVKWRDDFYTVMARVDFHYVRKEKITMYSGIALGASFTNSETLSGDENSAAELDNSTFFAFQLNAFGFRYGGAFGVYGEAGFGYNGIFNLGLSYMF